MNKKILIAEAFVLAFVILITPHKNTSVKNNMPNISYVGPHGDLSRVKIASLYEKVTDREVNSGRSLEETIRLLKQTRTDMIFRGFWVWNAPVPESPDNIPPEITNYAAERLNIKPDQVSEAIKKTGFSYEELKNTITFIKKEMPGVIFVGAIPAQTVGRIDMNPITGKLLNTEDTWAMALDPKKWNINFEYEGRIATKNDLQNLKASNNQETFKEGYDYHKANGYYPDITNPDFQELFLAWAQKQIDSGADAIWIDLLYSQANLLKTATKNADHLAVKESYAAANKLVDEIHKYGESKNKYIYVGTWAEYFVDFPPELPKIDFVTTSPTPEEISSGIFNNERWNKINAAIKTKFGNILYLAFIDWGGKPNAPIDVFSQQLSKKQQKEFLIKADEFFTNKGIIFVYPVHGADFWGNAKTRSFGKFNKYDSLAPEFDTYDTILELANKKTN